MSVLPRILLVLANLIPLVGVLAWDWDVTGILVLYWSENLVIGFFAIVKMVHREPLSGWFSAAFFLVHFGGFCAIHGFFLLALTRGDDIELFVGEDAWPFFLVFVQMLFSVTRHVLEIAPREWLLGFAGIVLSHGVSLAMNYFGQGEYKQATVKSLMSAPYRRILVTHFTILGGAWGVVAVGSPLPLLLVLVVLKTVIDVFFHLREHGEQVSAEETDYQRRPSPVTTS